MNTVFGNLPLGSCLAYQLQDYGRPNTIFVNNITRATAATDTPVPHCLEFPDIPVLQDAITPFDFTDLNVPVDQTDLTEFMHG